ncbi:MAG: hypothetical protein ACO3DK_08945, partial [Bacteroidia bacterium]
RAMEALKEYIAEQGAIKGVVLGDWNDDLDKSIYSNYATPFSAWMADPNFAMVSYRLSTSGQKSTVSYSDMIDHQAATPALKPFWVQDSSAVLYADKYISGYGNNTSDHYPVFACYYWNTLSLGWEAMTGAHMKVWFDGMGWASERSELGSWSVFDAQGRCLFQGQHLSHFQGESGHLYAFQWRGLGTSQVQRAWALQP